jgi:3-deoxy-D-manno-octulosonic-acid transferase
MIWLYRILFLPALVCLLPYYAWRMWRRGGYRHDFHHRFGLIDRPPPKRPGVKRIWIQAVSVGEANALGPLLRHLQARPNTEIVLTTTTSTGYKILREKYAAHLLKVGIFPLDFWPFSRNAWRRLDPDLAILMEAELWPEHLQQASLRHVPVILVNARMSDRSFTRYQRLRGVARRLLGQLRLILCASKPDEERFLHLGADPHRTRLTGSLKFDAAASAKKFSPVEIAALREELGFTSPAKSGHPLVLLGSSTWEGEEVLLLEVQQAAISCGLDVRLLLVPRHAERRKEIIALLERQPLPWHARSVSRQALQPVKIYLGDTTGELTRLTQAADVVFIGKSMPPHDGGQTPIEAAALGLPLVYGPCMSNFKDACRGLEEAGAAWHVMDTVAAHIALLGLLQDPQRRAQMGAAARAWHAANQGATHRTLEALDEVFR